MTHIIGYHGTNIVNGRSILTSKEFHIAGTFSDWLGRGTYFFENDKHQAYMFIKFREKDKPLVHNDICVLKADMYPVKLLDLLCDEDRRFIEDYCLKVKEQIEAKSKEIGNWKHKEGFIIDLLNYNNPIDAVRAGYSVPKAKKNLYLDYSVVQIQVCVKNIDCIDKSSICEVNCDAYR